MSGLEGLLAGRVLGGRYLIEEVIGRGGMGAVYRALDERLDRQVAVKVITVAGADDPEVRSRLRARFHREARAAAALPHHENVVPVYDYGTDEALGLDYLVMELLRGDDLAARLMQGSPPPLSASLKILSQAARGLAVGHRAGLIHRDVKPGNIFLAHTDDDALQVRVVDFGIAKLAADEDSLTQLTQDGRAPHSPAYASPEQLRGLTHLTPASDVFSLGAVGYQLLTGERPFSEADRNRMSLGMPTPAPPLRARNPAIPEAVEKVIQTALAPHPEDRFPDAGAMALTLDRVLRDLPELPLAPYGAGAPPAAGKPDAAGGDRTELLDEDRTEFLEEDHTLLATPEQALPSRPIARPRRHARPGATAERSTRRHTGLIVWIVVLVALAAAAYWVWNSTLPPGSRVAGRPEMDSLGATAAAPDTTRLLGLDARMYNEEGRRYYSARQFDSARIMFQRAVSADSGNADYRRNLGVALLALGEAEQAGQQFRQALELDPSLAVAYANLTQAQLKMADTTGALESLQEFLKRGTDPALRAAAEREIREIQAAHAGLLGVPLDTAPDLDSALPTPEQSPAGRSTE